MDPVTHEVVGKEKSSVERVNTGKTVRGDTVAIGVHNSKVKHTTYIAGLARMDGPYYEPETSKYPTELSSRRP